MRMYEFPEHMEYNEVFLANQKKRKKIKNFCMVNKQKSYAISKAQGLMLDPWKPEGARVLPRSLTGPQTL